MNLDNEQDQINNNLKGVKHKILVLSGKGGVGKSSMAVNLAVWLSTQGKKVGLLDVDIHGPSVPKLLGLEDRKIQNISDQIQPIKYTDTLKVMSVGFVIKDEDTALIWRGPMKHNVIKQFVCDVEWGQLDYLIVDCPPGTGDEPLSIVNLLGTPDGAVIITTPQQVAVTDVKKCITFCRHLELPILGLIENMSGFVCPHCNEVTTIFGDDGGKQLAKSFNIPLLGSIPLDPDMVPAADTGKPFIYFNSQNLASQAMTEAFEPLLLTDKKIKNDFKEQNKMRIAIPLAEGKLSLHFGHCEKFAILDIDDVTKAITSREDLTPPPHEPGVLPKWLGENNVNVIIAGGIGQRAQGLFVQNGIEVVVGASQDSPENLANAYLKNELEVGDNVCDH